MHTNNIFGTGMGFSDFTDKETGSIGGENGIRFGNSFNFFDNLKIRVGLGSFLGQGQRLWNLRDVSNQELLEQLQ